MTFCATNVEFTSGSCSLPTGKSRDGLPFELDESGFAFDGYRYSMRGKSVVTRNLRDNSEIVYNPSSPGQVEIAAHFDDDDLDQSRLRRENRRQAADKARREQEMWGAVMGAAQAIGGALAGGNVPQSYTPAYSPSSGGGSVAQPRGYAETMGTRTFVPLPAWTPAQQRAYEENERYKIREQLYGSRSNSGSSSSSGSRSASGSSSGEPFPGAYAEQDRIFREAEARRVETNAEIDASRKAESDAFWAGADRSQQSGSNSTSGGSAAASGAGSSSNASVRVSNGQPSETALKAAAEEKAKIAAGEEQRRLAEIERKRIEADMARQDAEFQKRINTFDKGVCDLSKDATVKCE
jgi:hypothetical protein